MVGLTPVFLFHQFWFKAAIHPCRKTWTSNNAITLLVLCSLPVSYISKKSSYHWVENSGMGSKEVRNVLGLCHSALLRWLVQLSINQKVPKAVWKQIYRGLKSGDIASTPQPIPLTYQLSIHSWHTQLLSVAIYFELYHDLPPPIDSKKSYQPNPRHIWPETSHRHELKPTKLVHPYLPTTAVSNYEWSRLSSLTSSPYSFNVYVCAELWWRIQFLDWFPAMIPIEFTPLLQGRSSRWCQAILV